MNPAPKVNLRRLASVAFFLWFMGASWIYLPRIEESFADAKNIAERHRQDLAREEFFRCASKNGVDQFAVARHYLNCKDEQNLECTTWYPCDIEIVTDSCARQRVPKCSDAGLPHFGIDAKAYNSDIQRKDIVFFFSSDRVHPLLEYVGLLLAPVILLILHRVAGRHLWRWLTSGHKT